MKKYIGALFVALALSITSTAFAGGGATLLTPGSVVFANPAGKNMGQDNANFFWDDTNNRLGLGTNTPASLLHLAGSMLRFDNFGSYPTLSFNRANGTKASPSAVLSSDELSRIDFGGYNGSSYVTGARLAASSRENWTGSANGTDLVFLTTGSTTAIPTEKMRLMGTGSLALGGSNIENYNLHIQENGRVELVATGYSSTGSPTASKTVIAARLANGSMAAPTHINNGQIIGEFAIGGYKNTAFSTSATAYILGTATEDFSDSATGTKLEFGVTPNTTTGTLTKMVLDQNGFLGVGDVTPETMLDVETTTASDVATFTNTTGTCTVNPATGVSCTSDRRAKKDILALDLTDALEKIVRLAPVSFHWKNDAASVVKTPGFIAQEVETVIPTAVETDEITGEKRLNQTGLIPYLVASVQAIAKKQDAMKEEIHTEKLCIGETCVTEKELQEFLEYKKSQE